MEAIEMACFGINVSPNGAANRAYYAAFYAVTAILALEDIKLKKHRAVVTSVHRDFVHTGRWAESLGENYSHLFKLRLMGDYSIERLVPIDEAKAAIDKSWSILEAVSKERPDLFPLPDKKLPF